MVKSDEKTTDTRNEVPVWPARNPTYRGFSTSICDLFRNRFDCCAFACCGIMLYDRSRFILTGEYPLSFQSRILRYVIVPLLIFISAGFCAVHVKDPYLNEFLSYILISLMILYLFISCFSSRRERIALRKEILDKIGRSGEQDITDLEQAHGFCCGCYTVDGHYDQWEMNGNDNNLTSNGDLCTQLWKCFARSCCGDRFNLFCQCCGICALAQEAREIEKLVDRRETWIDFITFEPYSAYFTEIVKLRISRNNNPWAHYKATSKLSRMLLKSLLAILVSLALLSFLKFNTMFTYENVLVFAATFFQAFITLYLVHWSVYKFELSLDAVIKYFTSGFLFTTGIAVFFETLLAFCLQVLLLVFAKIFANSLNLNDESKNGKTLLIKIGLEYPYISIIYLFLYSYVLAAFVEEVCKYFGYLMVQHPDFMTQESEMLLDRSLEYDDQDDESADRAENEANNKAVQEEAKNEAAGSLVAPARSLNSIGTAITIAMVTVALGFACCENLLYIFVYTGGTIEEEFAVLLARSAFPIHPLAAAIQSIQVCRQTLEKDEKIKIGRIVAPAVILHGTFDFSLMVVNFLYDLREAEAQGNEQDENNSVAGFAFKFGFGITFLAFNYFFWESSKQKDRLNNLQRSMQALLT